MLERGKPIPSTISEKPVVTQENLLFWQCWNDLSADRDVGQAVGWIRFATIDVWCRRHGIEDPELFSDIHRLVQAMDMVYVQHLLEQRKNQPNHGT